MHKSVLLHEVMCYLKAEKGGTFIDATFGAGGHTRAILAANDRNMVIAIDWDSHALDTYGIPLQEEFGDRLRLIWGSFAHLYKIVKKEKIGKVHGILADFGTSQVQIMEQSGFSVYRDTPLDMRMSRSHYHTTAQEVVNQASAEKLRQIFWQLGEERYAKQIVDLLMEERKKRLITTTMQLADIVARAIPKKSPRDTMHTIHPATRVFQALRMYVNNELDNIEAFLASTINVLGNEGRLVCISFHSLEDRIVKLFLQEQAQLGNLDVLTKKVVVAQPDEIQANPSSRSARLRAACCMRNSSD